MLAVMKRARAKPLSAKRAARVSATSVRLPATLEFMRSLWALDHALQTVSKRMHSELGLTGPQRMVLRVLGRSPNAMPSEIADLLHLDRGTMSGIVARLVTAGAVTRRAHPGDGRSTVLRLTAKGRAINAKSSGTIEACMRRALARLSPTDVSISRDTIETIVGELMKEE